jgi:hypothetical protein
VAGLFSVPKHLDLALNVAFFLGHSIHPPRCLSAS